jgi:hypothetical protein
MVRQFSKMCQDPSENRWENIQFTSDSDNIDVYAVINSPNHADYVPEKTIVIQGEPWVYDDSKPWGIHTWGEWAEPEESKFLWVHQCQKYPNPCIWELEEEHAFLSRHSPEKTMEDRISCVSSNKSHDVGHQLRIGLVRYLDTKEDVVVDVYGRKNYFGFKNYRSPIDHKSQALFPYRYYLMAENNSEHNYATEKIYECVLSETLCFYWGCPNLSDILDPGVFVPLDMSDLEGSYRIIRQSIENSEWEKRLPILRREKQKILNRYNVVALIHDIVSKTRDAYGKYFHWFDGKRLLFVLFTHDDNGSWLNEYDGEETIFVCRIGRPLYPRNRRIRICNFSRTDTPSYKCVLDEFTRRNPTVPVLFYHYRDPITLPTFWTVFRITNIPEPYDGIRCRDVEYYRRRDGLWKIIRT